jgi:hypothetical protein
MEIIPCIPSDHNAIKLELNNKNKDKKHANRWKLNNSLFSEQWVIDELKEEIKRFLEVNENENNLLEPMGHSKGSPERKVYSHECIYYKD